MCVCVCVLMACVILFFSLLFSDCHMHLLAALCAVWISKCVFLSVCGFVSCEVVCVCVCVFALKSRLQDADIIGAEDLTHCSPPLN